MEVAESFSDKEARAEINHGGRCKRMGGGRPVFPAVLMLYKPGTATAGSATDNQDVADTRVRPKRHSSVQTGRTGVWGVRVSPGKFSSEPPFLGSSSSSVNSVNIGSIPGAHD